MTLPLVGRDRELAELANRIDGTARGRGGVVLMSGEPGIGKSRLAEEAVELARRHGFTLAEGRAGPLLSGLAYAPIVQALHGHLLSMTDAELAGLRRVAPDLGLLFPDPRLAPPTAADAELQRTRMYEATLALTERLAARRPVLLFLDDLHWADRGTVELLHYLGRSARDLPVLVLACYRTGAVGGRGAAHDTVHTMAAATRRDPAGQHIELAPLDEIAVAELVRHCLGTPPRESQLRAVTSRAAGVALFVVALTRQLDAGQTEKRLPKLITDAVRDRINQLERADRVVLEVIAVAGGLGTLHMLRTVGRLADLDLQITLRRLIAGNLITEHRAGAELHYQMAHPLYAEVVYGELAGSGRRALHAAIGAALDTVRGADHGGSDHTLLIAPHYVAGGDNVPADRVVDVLSAAGRRAMTVCDPDEAASYLAAALRRARGVRPDLVPALLADLAMVQQGRGRLDDAAELLQDAITLSERHDQDHERRRGWQHLQALLEVERGNTPAAVRLARVGARRPSTDTPMRLMVHWIISLRNGDLPELTLISRELSALPSTQDTPVARSVARFGTGMLAAMTGRLATACAEVAAALELAALCGDDAPFVAFAPRMVLNGLSVLRGDLATAVRAADIDSTTPVRLLLPAATCYLQCMLAMTHYFAGDLAVALTEIDRGVLEARRVGQDRLVSRALAARAFLRAERGEFDGATADLAIARERYDAAQLDLMDAIDLAETALVLRRGGPAQAPAFADTLTFGDNQLNCLRTAYAGYAAVDAGDLAEADRVTGLLRAGGRDSPLLDALADRQQGLTATARGRRDDAADLLRNATSALGAMGSTLLAAQAELELAELLPPGDAAELIRSAAAAFAVAGATPWIQRAARLARTNRVNLAPRGPLTRRETEIAAFVGLGLSNADIAARLFLSERTVETHLRNVYRKLGLSSRISLAKWSQRRTTPPSHPSSDAAPGEVEYIG
ncbi:MAG TPA: AAA family ATPase [Actinophytocola sp.]|jgi:ATP/maltotriose-dependent transcriptional regulator MalT|nr:AAA family ATPase [Actinophytocola sp.]